MRPLLLTALLCLSGCGACRRAPHEDKPRVPAPSGGAATTEDVGDAGDAIVEGGHRYAVLSWSFPLDRYEVTIEDVGMTSAIEGILTRASAELVVNGGFFDKEGKGLGLALSDGATLAPYGKSLSGGVLTVGDGRARLQASESFALEDDARFAVQCRPRLVVDGAPNVKRDDGKRSERTALCIKDAGRTLEVYVVHGSDEERGPSLFALGQWLAAVRTCEDALNLDGGPSTGASWRDPTTAELHTLAPRGPIRHAIAFKKR